MGENEITDTIIGLAIKIHRRLGPGLLESSYQECLYYELKKACLKVEKQKPLPLIYDDVKLDVGYRIDLLVEEKIVIEIKSIEHFDRIHKFQVLTYLRLSGCKVGLLINLMSRFSRKGLHRLSITSTFVRLSAISA